MYFKAFSNYGGFSKILNRTLAKLCSRIDTCILLFNISFIRLNLLYKTIFS